MQVNVHEAKTQLSKLIEAALRGEEVIIARDGKPAVRIEPVSQGPAKFKFGLLKGLNPPDFLEPMSEAELKDWE
jgi:prevent-host-death family protein